MKIICYPGLSAAICLVIAPAAEAQGVGETGLTLPEVNVSAQSDEAFFAPDTASQGVVTGKQIEERASTEAQPAGMLALPAP